MLSTAKRIIKISWPGLDLFADLSCIGLCKLKKLMFEVDYLYGTIPKVLLFQQTELLKSVHLVKVITEH